MKKSMLCLALLLAPTLSPAAVTVYTAILSGAAESPPTASAGTGFATVTIDSTFNTMRVQVNFEGLTGNTTNTHIHAATAVPLTGNSGVATMLPTFFGFPGGVTAGAYDNIFDMTLAASYSAAYVTANGGTAATAFASLQAAMAAQKSYLNIHSTAFGTGEIRGFLVPEPGTATLAAIAGAGLLIRRRRH